MKLPYVIYDNLLFTLFLTFKEETTKEEEIEEEMKSASTVSNRPFQQIFAACPDGLNITYFLECVDGK